jgi:hypothetical protein
MILFITIAAVGESASAQGPSLVLAATRRDATGAVYAIPPVTDRKGDPQPPLLLPGEYVVVTGTAFPPNQPVQAALATPTHTFPLPYQNVNGASQPASQPVTDANGTFQDLTFVLPPADQVTDVTGQLVMIVGAVRQEAPVAIVTSAATTAGPGDKRAVAFGVGFSLLALIMLFLLIRGIPTYPERRARRRQRSAGSGAGCSSTVRWWQAFKPAT